MRSGVGVSPAPIGHNSGTVLQKDAQSQLKSIVERAEQITDNELHDAKEALKEVFAEAKGNGYHVPSLRKLIKLRSTDKAKVQEDNAILALYASAIGCEDLV